MKNATPETGCLKGFSNEQEPSNCWTRLITKRAKLSSDSVEQKLRIPSEQKIFDIEKTSYLVFR